MEEWTADNRGTGFEVFERDRFDHLGKPRNCPASLKRSVSDKTAVTAITDFAGPAGHMAQVSSDVVIIDGADTVTLLNTRLSDLQDAEFVF